MGLFSRNPDEHTIKHGDEDARRVNNRPNMHGSKAEWRLMSGMGSLTRWGGGDDWNVHVSGEKPGGGKQR